MWSCGGDSCLFCRRVRGAGGGGGAFGVTQEEMHDEILLFREKTEKKVQRSIALLEEMWRKRRREIYRQIH